MKYPNFNEEKKLWKRGYKYVVGLDEAGRGCERSDAEVLTNNGWKFYYNIDSDDKVLSYTNNGYIKWQKIEKIIEKDFKGKLIELKNRSIDIVVTPDHYFTAVRRVFRRDKKDNDRLKLIGYKTRKERRMVGELTDNDFIPRGGKWKGTNKKFFRLPEVDAKKKKLINIEPWVAFLGIFLSEGSVYHDRKKGSYKITISQNKNASPEKYKKIYNLLKKLPFKFNNLKDGFVCYNKQLYTYLRQFGKRYNKFIPRDIKELPQDLLNILIKWMIMGDGCCYTNRNRKEICIYYTVSKKLKDDFEEILLKAGWTYHTSVRAPKDTYIGRRLIKKENKVPCFETRLRRNNKAIVKHLHKKEVFHRGRVFCLQLSSHHNFYVRRNGTGYFTGNSLAASVVAAAVFIKSGKGLNKLGIKDSKKLTSQKREEIFKILEDSPKIEWGMGIVSEKVIDKINILEATKLAMVKAVKNLEKKLQFPASPNSHDRRNLEKLDFLILDGNFEIDGKYFKKNYIGQIKTIPQKTIIRGDEKVFSCALASIFAKVRRDRIMHKLHKKYSQYGFNKHKGYPTKVHFASLQKFGPCKIHRKSFYPVSQL